MGQRERTPPGWPDSQLCGPQTGWRAGVPVSTETHAASFGSLSSPGGADLP